MRTNWAMLRIDNTLRVLLRSTIIKSKHINLTDLYVVSRGLFFFDFERNWTPGKLERVGYRCLSSFLNISALLDRATNVIY